MISVVACNFTVAMPGRGPITSGVALWRPMPVAVMVMRSKARNLAQAIMVSRHTSLLIMRAIYISATTLHCNWKRFVEYISEICGKFRRKHQFNMFSQLQTPVVMRATLSSTCSATLLHDELNSIFYHIIRPLFHHFGVTLLILLSFFLSFRIHNNQSNKCRRFFYKNP